MARKLEKIGYSHLYVLKGGWHAWQAAGYPVEPK
ncbi:MAG: hypothetical protein C4530_06000 [Desulfobacteraceae bacterium]|nr:MAG: hypothetical protein C4530_06000 [Desulfobacteraceae bacterium]